MASEQQGQAPMSFENGDHRHSGWFCCEEHLVKLAARIKADECATVSWRPATEKPLPGAQRRNLGFVSDNPYGARLWCLTHGVPESFGHSKSMEAKERAREDHAEGSSTDSLRA